MNDISQYIEWSAKHARWPNTDVKLSTDAEHNLAYMVWFVAKRVCRKKGYELQQPMPRRVIKDA